MTNMDNDVKKDSKEPAEGTYKGHKDIKKVVEHDVDNDVYSKAECVEDDTNIVIPDDDSVEDAREWIDENKR